MILDTISGIDSIVEGEGGDSSSSDAKDPVASTSPSASLPRCGSCGKDASVRRWYASPTDEVRHPEYQCGRCAYLTSGDTLGTVASLLFDLGASDD